MSLEKGREIMMRALRGEATGAELLGYLNSPEYQRHKAAREAEDLKMQLAGRAKLFELIEKAQAAGARITYERVPLGHGHDSIMVSLAKPFSTLSTGFPSWLWPESVEEGFSDLMKSPREARS